MDNSLYILAAVAIAVSFFLLHRNYVVYKIKRKAIDRASELARKSIDNGDLDWAKYYPMLETRSYSHLMLNITIWSAEAAYPQLYNELEN